MTRDLTPTEARRKVAACAKPGREYTVRDLANISGLSLGQARAAANWLARNGMFLSHEAWGEQSAMKVYRRNEAWVRGDTTRCKADGRQPRKPVTF